MPKNYQFFYDNINTDDVAEDARLDELEVLHLFATQKGIDSDVGVKVRAFRFRAGFAVPDPLPEALERLVVAGRYPPPEKIEGWRSAGCDVTCADPGMAPILPATPCSWFSVLQPTTR